MTDEKSSNILDQWDTIKDSIANRTLAVFLDYDGTLTPIVKNPSEARISEDMMKAVDAVGRKFKTAIVTGRSIKTISDFVKLPHIYFAGSHGFDIRTPDGSSKQVCPNVPVTWSSAYCRPIKINCWLFGRRQ